MMDWYLEDGFVIRKISVLEGGGGNLLEVESIFRDTRDSQARPLRGSRHCHLLADHCGQLAEPKLYAARFQRNGTTDRTANY